MILTCFDNTWSSFASRIAAATFQKLISFLIHDIFKFVDESQKYPIPLFYFM